MGVRSYTWDARGNLRSNSVFTYTYDGAEHRVRAESVSATVVYTYIADSRRDEAMKIRARGAISAFLFRVRTDPCVIDWELPADPTKTLRTLLTR